MPEHTMTVQAECDACDGTGLYVGMAERDGFAVQCHNCKGTGERQVTFRWRDFEGRQPRDGVLRVLQANPGIVVGGYDTEAFGGLDFVAWERGEPFGLGTEMREFTCPAWWYQTADYKRKPDWQECRSSFGRRFSDCPYFPTKAKCWARFDAEYAPTPEPGGDDGR